MDYIEADEAVFEAVTEHDANTALWATVRRSAFPQTYRAMFGFFVKVNALKTAMFDMIESENPYAFKALFRCFCEHYLKFTFLFFRFTRERSDAVGVEYFSYCGAAEAREYSEALIRHVALLGGEAPPESRQSARDHIPRGVSGCGRLNRRRVGGGIGAVQVPQNPELPQQQLRRHHLHERSLPCEHPADIR